MVFGHLTDRFGRRKFFFLSLSIYLAGVGLTAFSWNLASFAVFRFVETLAAAFEDREGTSGLIALAEQALRIHPGDALILRSFPVVVCRRPGRTVRLMHHRSVSRFRLSTPAGPPT